MKRPLSILLLFAISLIIGLTGHSLDKQVSAKTDRTPEGFKELLSEIGTEGLDYKEYLTQY
ncbi:MAG TPA: hypothetical protein GX731_07170, partial [Clostridiales bacterium]|nr:hypothetical protein [Clostridiales bacterium]